ncbi:ribosome-associated translation inhibitor RaiA [Zobellia galactanivorans]|uniref:Possible Sigma-54 modulation protein n=2 Tax=Zobellia TaxID=112040 RepID=G0LA83_ZOBGA|nr:MULTISPECIES: ribosome-associated translation inhibitor RaiA [Zobellia]MBU3028379.1 ribosome-associated translation inhibitor RaiA [Zobellia galactanivorans]MDO6810452.1 ribosome-associated translation inhibitor RaiA [Zobellia galactanivorans]OWW26193.1 ribosomal subunit interface protein [Zobellia sp. OII3]CAZ95132.1 Possible Sigma-54 modulation protein [Zobellia galactanivorans]SIS42950.1 putative sigma-54 modulation protein [Zobellia uliginosa]
MQIIYEYHDVSASQRLEGLAKEKLEKLEKKYDFVHRADVFFKTENRSDDYGMFCDIRLSMPGPRIFASSNAETFDTALNETVRDLEHQLRKIKEKMSEH